MTAPQSEGPLLARVGALKLHGLIAHWDEIANADWLEPLIQWEEQERAHRSLEQRLSSAKLGRFKPLADFDWSWPRQCEREVVEELMRLDFLREATNVILVGPNGVCVFRRFRPPSPTQTGHLIRGKSATPEEWRHRVG